MKENVERKGGEGCRASKRKGRGTTRRPFVGQAGQQREKDYRRRTKRL
jgi:hypothetical protein